MSKKTIDAQGVYYKQLNEQIRQAVAEGATEIELCNVNGQRYIATGLAADVKFLVRGTPGQDMAAFMRGPTIRVLGNALAFRLFRKLGTLPAYEEGLNAVRIQQIGIPGL